MHHVDKWGIGKVVEMALEYVGKDRPIHLSFDIGKLLFTLHDNICGSVAHSSLFVQMLSILPSLPRLELP